MDLNEFRNLKKKIKILQDSAKILRVTPQDLPKVIKRFLNEIKEMKEEIGKSS